MKEKLAKITITLSLTHIDWIRFWNQLKPKTDKSNFPPIPEFSYLGEMLELKEHSLTDGLSFNTERYKQAKNILTSKYEKVSEVVNAIIALPIIHDSNPIRIHEFYEKLMIHVQSLETVQKLTTLDKLPQIWWDLVRLDGEWQQWNFLKLTDALPQWVKRNYLNR